MRIAILGATSEIGRDLQLSFSGQNNYELVLYARRPAVALQWLASAGLPGRYLIADLADFSPGEHFDVVINFVGVGDPVKAAALGASIFDLTVKYDDLALSYIRQHPECRYLFLTSGAAYGSDFDSPIDYDTKAVIALNNLQPQDWYGVAKLHAECRHRSLRHLPIIDLRIFNYFSHTQDRAARFLMMDVLRAVHEETVLLTSSDYIVRDYIHPSDFFNLICLVLSAPEHNAAIDCYSKEVIDKPTLLTAMKEKFGLRFEVTEGSVTVNATGIKPHYYSLNKHAATYGYSPRFTSLEGIVKEVTVALAYV